MRSGAESKRGTVHLGQRIRAAREERGWSQESLGALVGRTGETVSRWETGQIPVSFPMLERLANVFGVTVGDLIG